VNDSLAMGEIHGQSQDLHHLGGMHDRLRRGGQPLLQTAAVHVLQRQERAAAVLADFVDLDDVRMLQLADGFGFRAKTGQLGLTGMAACENHLEGDHALQAALAGLVDHAHRPAAEGFEDFVTGDELVFARPVFACRVLQRERSRAGSRARNPVQRGIAAGLPRHIIKRADLIGRRALGRRNILGRLIILLELPIEGHVDRDALGCRGGLGVGGRFFLSRLGACRSASLVLVSQLVQVCR
jgi:hypothetical protein